MGEYPRASMLLSCTNFTALMKISWGVLSSMGPRPCNLNEANMMNNTNQFRWDP